MLIHSWFFPDMPIWLGLFDKILVNADTLQIWFEKEMTVNRLKQMSPTNGYFKILKEKLRTYSPKGVRREQNPTWKQAKGRTNEVTNWSILCLTPTEEN